MPCLKYQCFYGKLVALLPIHPNTMTASSSHPSAAFAEPALLLRTIPSVDAVLQTMEAKALLLTMSRERLAEITRRTIEELRSELRRDGAGDELPSKDADEIRALLL